MFVRIAVFLLVAWVALVLFGILLRGLIHLLVIAAVIFLILKLVEMARKSTV
jgi:large-conductance mechanosensitive channel